MLFNAINRQGTHSVKWDEIKKKFGTYDLIPLWVADMDFASASCVQESMKKRALHPVYGYTIYPDSYYESIQNWMEKRFLWKIKKEWIVPCYGVVPSLNFAINAYSKVGDGIIIQTPLYPPFVSSIKHKNRKVLDNILMYKDRRYQVDFEDFECKAKEAKLFLLCSPHNPTGRAWCDDELEKIIDICLANNILIISDEIHADIVYKKIYRSIGSFAEIQNRCVIFNAPSKTFNIAGLNTSYAIIPNKKLRQAYYIEQKKSGITNGNPFGIEALISAYSDGEEWLDELNNYLYANILYVKNFLKEWSIPIVPVETEATFLIWLDCHGLGLTSQSLVDFFLKEAKLGLNEGSSFGKAGEGFMRLNIGTSKDVLEESMQRLLKAYRRRG